MVDLGFSSALHGFERRVWSVTFVFVFLVSVFLLFSFFPFFLSFFLSFFLLLDVLRC